MKYKIQFNNPTITGDEEYHVLQAMRSSKVSGDGSYGQKCQTWFEQNTSCAKALLTPSCTAALEMAAILLDVQPGDEVIMPSYTFVSTANAFALRGANIMKGYYKNPEATSQDIVDGWFHTGDVGKVDDDGFVFITGRKKEIYVSSSGKNIAPLVIEETMKSIPLVSQCFLVGDSRKYCSALFTLDVSVILRDKINVDIAKIPKDPAQQIKMLEEHSYKLSDFTDNNEVFSELEKEVNKLNNEFSNPEQIKKFSILPRDFTIDEGELTPTLKIRRKQINENWASEIESMYSE